MHQRTHEKIAPHLCGPVELGAERARLTMEATAEMAADSRGLVHGGFTFGLTDHAAMLAVNEPTVVLASAQVKFLGPVVTGDRVEAEASVDVVRRDGTPVLEGEFLAIVPATHILDVNASKEPRR